MSWNSCTSTPNAHIPNSDVLGQCGSLTDFTHHVSGWNNHYLHEVSICFHRWTLQNTILSVGSPCHKTIVDMLLWSCDFNGSLNRDIIFTPATVCLEFIYAPTPYTCVCVTQEKLREFIILRDSTRYLKKNIFISLFQSCFLWFLVEVSCGLPLLHLKCVDLGERLILPGCLLLWCSNVRLIPVTNIKTHLRCHAQDYDSFQMTFNCTKEHFCIFMV